MAAPELPYSSHALTKSQGQELHKYLNNIYKWFGLPNKIISDRNPQFTSHFG